VVFFSLVALSLTTFAGQLRQGDTMSRSIVTASAILAALTLSACSETATEPFSPPMSELSSEPRSENNFRAPKKGDASIAEIAIAAGFSELVEALQYVDGELSTGLVDLFLNGTDQYTVFAPTNDAFTDLYGLLSVVLNTQIDEITDIPAPVVLDVLLYHVVEGRRAANSVVPRNGERTMMSLLGEKFYVRTDGTLRDGLTGLRDDAAIDGANISARNGIIHVITEVIVPPSVVAALTS